ncbi:MAG: hypothetical protein KI790_00045 [Cyclobacteriaceae bacterium]|nr:hypothetical protein [Cyclobacteriaceae bacterium HetDA_MAG_MS6]
MRPLQNIFIIVLALSTIANTLMVPLIYLDFNMRKDYISEVLCINRDNPITVCGGKCYLNIQLEKANRSSEKQESKSIERQLEISFFSQELQTVSFSQIAGPLDQSYLFAFDSGGSRSFYGEIFRPPQFI